MQSAEPIIRRQLRDGLALSLVCCALVSNTSCRRTVAPPNGNGQPAMSSDAVSPAEHTAVVSGKDLFGNYCAQCHGEKGDGNGPAARFLYPRPRNFGEAKFRIVTTANNMPSDQDLLHVVNRGMPGSAMFSFAHLSEDAKTALVAYVRQLEKDLLFERAKADAGPGTDVAELSRDVDQVIQPGEPLSVLAEVLSPGPESVARGTQLFVSEGCVSCHGKTGKGDGVQEQKDSSGMPTHPRDFTRGIFKGGREPQQIYARIALGMPGSPMPASPKLQAQQIADLANFILSLSDPATQAKVEQTRKQVAVKKSTTTLVDSISEAEWDAAPSTPIVVSPLWWRNDAEPDLRVQALHDGKTLAVRLRWKDASRDDSPIRPQDFEDMAAIQLFKGAPEPFLGMGMANKSVDVWLWRAGWQGDARLADVDTAYPRMHVDMYPFEKPSTGPREHPRRNQPPEFITAQAAGNLRSNPAEAFSGGSLEAKGFGTLTMRPKVSQLVSATGIWANGQWTVVLRRPLEVPDGAGLNIAPNDRLSIAFAIWDGAFRDRNGQKLVSIWHDLQLE
jgi:DMSO reductase family type II enzyme heme b subunit